MMSATKSKGETEAGQKKAVKDVLLWRNTSNALGLDLRETLIRTFEEAGGHTHCHEIHSLTVDKGYRRINAQLVGGQVPKNRSAASPKNTTQVGAGPMAQLAARASNSSHGLNLQRLQLRKTAAPREAARKRQQKA